MRRFIVSLALFALIHPMGDRFSVADEFVYELSGTLDGDFGIYSSGTAFSGTFSYSTLNNPDTIGSTNIGLYVASGVALTIGCESVYTNTGSILIENQVNGGDRLIAEGDTVGSIGGTSNPTVRWNLRGNGGANSTVFSDDSLLDPSDFTENPRLVVFDSDGFFVVSGTFDSFSGSFVPEPGCFAIGSVFFGFAMIRRRR